MSIKRLAEVAVEELTEAREASVAPPPAGGTPPPAPVPGNNAVAIDNALSALLQYIPTEATAIYLATSSAVPAIQQNIQGFDPVYVYWIFVLIIAPLLFVLLYYNQLARTGEQFPGFGGFPWFRFVASGIAFAVWALCIPGNPYAPEDKPGFGVLWSVVAIVVAVFLPLIENIYNSSRRAV